MQTKSSSKTTTRLFGLCLRPLGGVNLNIGIIISARFLSATDVSHSHVVVTLCWSSRHREPWHLNTYITWQLLQCSRCIQPRTQILQNIRSRHKRLIICLFYILLHNNNTKWQWKVTVINVQTELSLENIQANTKGKCYEEDKGLCNWLDKVELTVSGTIIDLLGYVVVQHKSALASGWTRLSCSFSLPYSLGLTLSCTLMGSNILNTTLPHDWLDSCHVHAMDNLLRITQTINF